MFKQVFIVQVASTGEFLTHRLNYSKNLNRAGYFMDKQSAIDTALNELDTDFQIHDFYKLEHEIPIYQ